MKLTAIFILTCACALSSCIKPNVDSKSINNNANNEIKILSDNVKFKNHEKANSVREEVITFATSDEVKITGNFPEGKLIINFETRADKFKDIPAKMQVRIGDGAPVTFDVKNQSWAPLELRIDNNKQSSEMYISFLNDNFDPITKEDLNLYIRKITVHSK